MDSTDWVNTMIQARAELLQAIRDTVKRAAEVDSDTYGCDSQSVNQLAGMAVVLTSKYSHYLNMKNRQLAQRFVRSDPKVEDGHA